MAETLWLERARGMPQAFPSPTDQKARWRSSEGIAPTLMPAGAPSGPFSAAIVTPRCGVGGSEKVMWALAQSIERQTGLPVLIVVADTAVRGKDLPPGAIGLGAASVRGELFVRAATPVRAMVLRDLLVQSGAPRVIAINSYAANLLLQDGALQKAGVKTASAMFCVSVGAGGAIEGYVQIADWLIDAGVTLFTDNQHIARMMAAQNFYADTVVLDMPEQVAAGPPPAGANILWAGRIDTQKRPDLLLEVARLRPTLTFETWGAPLLEDAPIMAELAAQPNIAYRGPFAAFDDIDLNSVGAMLYTSGYDGTPNILLEAMARGLPCVCSGVGGIPDLMAEERGLIVDERADALTYAEALDALMSDASRRHDMAKRGRAYIETHHTQDGFDRGVARLLEVMQ
jgi:glycosyltransferase involved in cell wall biosynthesis